MSKNYTNFAPNFEKKEYSSTIFVNKITKFSREKELFGRNKYMNGILWQI